jgi:phage replication-related protein YjqB (UPF0714/DUF867 family)
MAKDTYNSFNELKLHEELNKDYKISICDVKSPVTIVAPHGGKIEPRTSYVANSIAANKFNCYCFEGIKVSNNGSLHITSHNFDEPHALKIIARSETVVTVHACTDIKPLIYLGGLNEAQIRVIAEGLKAAEIMVAEPNSKYRGINPDNICNRGATGKGVQLEISRGLRDDLNKVHLLSVTVHIALAEIMI